MYADLLLLADDDKLEVTGQTGAQGECTEAQVNLMLALAEDEMRADVLAEEVGISEEALAVLVRDTDCVSPMMKDDDAKKGAKERGGRVDERAVVSSTRCICRVLGGEPVLLHKANAVDVAGGVTVKVAYCVGVVKVAWQHNMADVQLVSPQTSE